MNVLFEEDGSFKTGTILADNDTSLQVETSTGKRIKLKSANVLLRFNAPTPAELLTRAGTEAESLDTEFLWEMCADAEFGFVDFAQEYYGHAPSAVESAAVLVRLFGAPVYFHRKGKGRFRKAPPEILQAALAGLEKKRLQQESVDRMKNELLTGTLPAEFVPMLSQMLYKPDRNRLETKALEAACEEGNISVPKLMLKVGALPSSHEYHLGRFLYEYFPEGTGFADLPLPVLPEDLPVANVRAFSLDDASTTEIDDALSITSREEGGWRIGIHIAAPALSIGHDSPVDEVARKRLSTVYMPGKKITMLPDPIVEAFTLGEGIARPTVSLYVDIGSDYVMHGHHSCIERVPVAANLRLHEIEPLFNDTTLLEGGPDFEWKRELTLLWEFACVLEAGRGKPSANQNMHDYNYSVDWDVDTRDGPGQISIEKRRRGSPLDKLISELMILANSTWGKQLHEAGIPAIYRAQGAGKVRMTTAAAPHEGLGVDCYSWVTSPLRRYVDLCNQWQLISLLRSEAPYFAPGSSKLAAAMNDFDMTYSAYAELQRGMERYWCIRWLRQEGQKDVNARILRDNIVRLEELPFVFKVHSLPNLPSGTRVQLHIDSSDLLDIDLRAKYVATLPALENDCGAESLSDLEEDLPESLEKEMNAVETLAESTPPPAQTEAGVKNDSEQTGLSA